MPTGVSGAKAAAHLYMSTVTFRELIDRGVITKVSGQGYDLDKVRQEYILYIRQIASGRAGKTTDGLDPLAERARKDKEMADRVALQNAVTRGELAPIRHFQDVLEDAFIRFRSRLVSMASTLAPRLEGASRVEIKALITAQIDDALDEIKNTKYEAPAKRFTKEADLPDDEEETEE